MFLLLVKIVQVAYKWYFFSFQPSVAFHIGASQTKQMTGFYMKCNSGLKSVKMSKVEIVWFSKNDKGLVTQRNHLQILSFPLHFIKFKISTFLDTDILDILII